MALVRLRDGTEVLLRPVEPADAPRLREGLELLSPRSRRMRFGSPRGGLTEREARYLASVDGCDHAAWIALDPADPASPALGVARYVRLPDRPDLAEAAVAVSDRLQGRGLGTLLLGALAATAIARGIRTFRAWVLAENREMLAILDALGAVPAGREEGLLEIDVPLPDDPARCPDSPVGRVLRAFAGGELR